MDIIKIAQEQTTLDYWSGLGSGAVVDNKTVANRSQLNSALREVFEPIMEGLVEWTDIGLVETFDSPYYDEPEQFENLWDYCVHNFQGVMVGNPFVMLIG
tara:strand:- start:181 stop:480 length:300 start_codon:yes stop_codon:yes gene_type:complete